MNVQQSQPPPSRGWRRSVWQACRPAIAGGLAVTTVLGGNLTGAPDDEAVAPSMRAAFVYRLTEFVEWPTLPGAARTAELRVGVWGDPATVPSLVALLAGRTIAGRHAVVIAARRVEDLANCQVVFLSGRSGGDVRLALERCTARGTLTIGEGIAGLARKVIVSFEVRNDRIHFAVNRDAAARAGLRLSSRLLNLAAPITSPTTTPRD